MSSDDDRSALGDGAEDSQAFAPGNAARDDASSPTIGAGVAYGERRSNRATSFSRRDSSALDPVQFMEAEVYLAAAELCLMMCSTLGHLAVLLILLQCRLLTVLAHWQRMSTTATCLLEHLQDTINKVKDVVGHILVNIC